MDSHARRFALVLAIASPGCAGTIVAPPPEPVVDIDSRGSEAVQPAAAVATAPGDADGMVLVAAGFFPRGCSPDDPHCYENEKPARKVYLNAFRIDRTEVTVAAYRKCVLAGGCTDNGLDSHVVMETTRNAPSVGLNRSRATEAAPSKECNWEKPHREKHPINCVDWHQAAAYCGWAGKRLPTEAEWEKAARGTSPRIYPWGYQAMSCRLAVIRADGAGVCGNRGTAEVGSKPEGRSPYGLLDMTGNVTEWVADWYAEDYYAHGSDRNPSGPDAGAFRVIRGGSWLGAIQGTIDALRISNRYSYSPHLRFSFTGFRCARSVAAQVAG